jgi:ATP-dependent RNA circularization protein (DNA/RNA ligase family)
MDSDFVKFPATSHLLWLGNSPARDDKLWTRAEAEAFLRHPVIVEEKVDGANLGISFDSNGDLLVQNRGHLVERGTKGQFAPLWPWLKEHEAALFDALENGLILFGEWCYARHSIHYTRLPDWYLSFDVFDKRCKCFLATEKRNEIVGKIPLTTVPEVDRGVFSLSEIPRLIGQSSLYDGPMEGIYLRHESESRLIQRTKVVRAEFVQQIGEHWSKQTLVPNRRQIAHV